MRLAVASLTDPRCAHGRQYNGFAKSCLARIRLECGFNLANPICSCSVVHGFDARFGKVPRHAAYPRAV